MLEIKETRTTKRVKAIYDHLISIGWIPTDRERRADWPDWFNFHLASPLYAEARDLNRLFYREQMAATEGWSREKRDYIQTVLTKQVRIHMWPDGTFKRESSGTGRWPRDQALKDIERWALAQTADFPTSFDHVDLWLELKDARHAANRVDAKVESLRAELDRAREAAEVERAKVTALEEAWEDMTR